ncbi:MAG: glycosyltransferase [Flavobacteriaceae bacterium]|nr:glycosyltransferase [Flavobacteriaceae bacterium]
MKILLVGEYSRLHNSLKEGLMALGHEVTLVGTGDGFKKYPADILLTPPYTHGWKKKLNVIAYRLLGMDLNSISIKKQFFSKRLKLKGYDVVQLINESPLGIRPKHEKEIIQFLKEHNEQLFLLSCGTDHISVQHSLEKKPRYSILSPLFEGKVNDSTYAPILKYVQPSYQDLHRFVYERIEGVIASDIDYHLPLLGHPKYLGMIPNPINIDNLKYYLPSLEDKVHVFHGINRANYFKKGSDIFEQALAKIQKRYPDKVTVTTVEDIPYASYIKKYDEAHILMDQIWAYDQGYNALEAMAKGKVVFTGAEQEFKAHYQLDQSVAINALPDVASVYNELEQLVLDREIIKKISHNARDFIEREHECQKIAQRYIDIWTPQRK